MLALATLQGDTAARVDQLGDGLRKELGALSDELKALRWWLEQTSRRGDELAGNVEALIGDQEALQQLRDHLQNLASELRRVGRLVPDDAALYGPNGLALERFDAGLGGTVVGYRDGGTDVEDALYLSFENWFRGPEEVIRERQLAYLPLLRGRRDVLDVGCGRGEFLDALRSAEIPGRGTDLDPAMVEHCRAKGLVADEGDAVSFLAAAGDGSFGAVFAAQVIEHLSYDDLIAFLRLCTTKLSADGLMIVETVNPHCPQALKHFWLDPTHRNPLFPETVVGLCRLVGFGSAYIWHPQGVGDPDRDRLEQGDYAVVAHPI